MFTCTHCDASFEGKQDLDLHRTNVHLVLQGKACQFCSEITNEKLLRRHELSCGESNCIACNKCGAKFRNEYNGSRHEEICANTSPEIANNGPSKNQLLATVVDSGGLIEYETAFENRLKSYFIRCEDCHDLLSFLSSCKNAVVKTIKDQLKIHRALKVNLLVECRFTNSIGETSVRTIKTVNSPVYSETNLEQFLFNKYNKITTEMEESMLKKSGWSLSEVDSLHLRINKHNPLRGSTYIPLPACVASKKACVNVKNYDAKCFMYTILAKFVTKQPQRVSKYKTLTEKYDFKCLSFPTSLNDIHWFEKQNNISINVFGVDEKGEIYPLKVVDKELPDHRDLLLLEDGEKKHYVYIRNFDKLVRSQITKHTGRILTCKRCFAHFDNRNGTKAKVKLEEHKRLCSNHPIAIIEMPSKKPIVEFKSVERALKVPYVIYADFESILVPHSRPDNTSSYTLPYQTHIPMSYAIYVKSTHSVDTTLPDKPIIYRGSDAAEKFMAQLIEITQKVETIYSRNQPVEELSEQQLMDHRLAEECYLCKKNFTVDDRKVLDHDHLNGRVRGSAHNSCNLKCTNPNFIPVFIHNLSGYDAHFIINQLGCDTSKVEVIPSTEKKYISFSKRVGRMKIRFIDTFRFMSFSLDKLVRNLPQHPETTKFFGIENTKLVCRKGVFPYDYIDSWEKLEEGSLPKKEDFYSQLNESDVTDEDYSHAQLIWEKFNCATLGEYSDLYLLTDVLLLADVFEAFRDSTLKSHGLDPAFYFTLPGLSYDAMLKYTNIKLELLQDYEQLLMVESGIRGGICQVSHRFAEANNKYVPGYNENMPTQFITYENANNQYGWAMCHHLPYGGFEWVDPASIDLSKMHGDDPVGYILDVDIEYPQQLHKVHNDFPFLPEAIVPQGSVHKKLIAHLGNRNHYVVHYMSLKQALNHGLKLVKIHRALKFHQSPWLKDYIKFNTSRRKSATNKFEKYLYKLFNNAIFGKPMEGIKWMDIRLVTNVKTLEKLIAKNTFIDRTIYGPNLASVHLAKRKIIFDKPIYIGMCILDISKTLIYKYHYDVLLPFYRPERLKLMYTDTDSFIHLIQTDDIYQDKLNFMKYLDTSDYPPEHLCYSTLNKKVLGKFKDEAQAKIVTAFVGLRAKMYAIKINGECALKKAKGVKKIALKRNIEFDDYVKCISSATPMLTPMRMIMSKQHTVASCEVNKISLSGADDKRVILEDGISTRAIGYEPMDSESN